MPTLLTLPNEIIFFIAAYLSSSNLNALLQTQRELFYLLQPVLYKLALTTKLEGGASVLHWAAKNGLASTALAVLETGADINEQDFSPPRWLNEHGSTAIHHVIRGGHEKLVKLLLEKGAKIDYRGPSHGGSVHHLAMRSGNKKIVELLLESEADYAMGTNGSWILKMAVRCGSVGMLQLFLSKGAVIDVGGRPGAIGLRNAAKTGNVETVKFLVEKGVDVNGFYGHRKLGIAPLCAAVQSGNVEIVEFLVEKGADINGTFGRRNPGSTPLHVAIRFNRETLVRYLIELGVDIGIFCTSGKTALHEAAREGNDKAIQLLLAKGADVNSSPSNLRYGVTPIFLAAKHGNLSSVRLLIERGAHLNIKDLEGRTVLDLAKTARHNDVAQLLEDSGAVQSICF